jgi:hypothetical protein
MPVNNKLKGVLGEAEGVPVKRGVECGAANFIATMDVPQKKNGDINSNSPRVLASRLLSEEFSSTGWPVPSAV